MSIATAGNNVSLYIFLAFIAFMVARQTATALMKRYRNVSTPDTPLLLAYYADGADILPIAKGMIHDMHFTTFTTLGLASQASATDRPALFIAVDLPFRTKIHLLAVPTGFHNIQIDPSKQQGLIEKVDLEGNYDDYFSLFAEKGMQMEARYVLDPAAMEFTIDFCKSYNWEIIKDTLYLVIAGDNDPNDKTSIKDDIARFVAEIRPAIEDKDNPIEEKLRTPYGDDYRDDLKCPLCNKTLVNKATYMICPDNDGVLINGEHLMQLRQGTLSIPMPTTTAAKQRPEHLICPSCGSQMEHVAYNGSTVIIDSCESCPYRWLDAGELIKPLEA